MEGKHPGKSVRLAFGVEPWEKNILSIFPMYYDSIYQINELLGNFTLKVTNLLPIKYSTGTQSSFFFL